MPKHTDQITPLGQPLTVDPRLRTKERQPQVGPERVTFGGYTPADLLEEERQRHRQTNLMRRAIVSFLEGCVVTDVTFGKDDAIVGLVLKSGEGE